MNTHLPKKKRKPVYIDLTTDNSLMEPLSLFKEKRVYTPQEDVNRFHLFPNELILKIMSFLPPKDLVQFFSTCKMFNVMSCNETLWKNIFINCRYDIESPMAKSNLEKTGSWKSTFIIRYIHSLKSWSSSTEIIYTKPAFWASISALNSHIFVLTMDSLEVINKDLTVIQSIDFNTCQSVYSTFYPAEQWPTRDVFYSLPLNNIVRIFHNKKNDTIIMFHITRGILIFNWEASSLKLVHEISFQLLACGPVLNICHDFKNDVIVCTLFNSLYIIDYKLAHKMSNLTPILIFISKNEESCFSCLKVANDYVFWTTNYEESSLYKVSSREFIDISFYKKNARGSLSFLLTDGINIYMVTESFNNQKIEVFNITERTRREIESYKGSTGLWLYKYNNESFNTTMFLSTNIGGIIKLWDAKLSKCMDVYSISPLKPTEVNCLLCIEDLLFASEDDKLVVWNLNKKELIFTSNKKSINYIDYCDDVFLTIGKKNLSIHMIE